MNLPSNLFSSINGSLWACLSGPVIVPGHTCHHMACFSCDNKEIVSEKWHVSKTQCKSWQISEYISQRRPARPSQGTNKKENNKEKGIELQTYLFCCAHSLCGVPTIVNLKRTSELLAFWGVDG